MVKLKNQCSILRSAARLERKSFFACTQVLFIWKLSAKKIGSGRRKSCPNYYN